MVLWVKKRYQYSFHFVWHQFKECSDPDLKLHIGADVGIFYLVDDLHFGLSSS